MLTNILEYDLQFNLTKLQFLGNVVMSFQPENSFLTPQYADPMI